jgi:MscS family membrane protein
MTRVIGTSSFSSPEKKSGWPGVLWLVVVVAVVACNAPGLAQESPQLDAEPAETSGDASKRKPADPYDSSVPVGAVRSYIDACREGDYGKAAGFLVLDSVADAERRGVGLKYAWQLEVVLDRKLWVRYELLSDRPGGNLDDGLPPNLDRLGSIGDFEVLLERVTNEQGARVWKFSSGTVESIPLLYSRYGFGPLGEVLPAPLLKIEFLELRLWQWIGLVLLLGAAVLVAWILATVVRRIGRSIVSRTETPVDDRLLDRLLGPFRFLLTVVLFAAGSVLLALSVPAYRFLNTLEIAFAVLSVTWGLLRTVDVAAGLYVERLKTEERKELISVVPLASRVAKSLILALALIALLQNVGFDVTGLIAGLGVGGLAVALAAQKSIANLFGGVSLVADQPIRVGDFCKYGDNKMGTVEEIGIRSTRVRTPDRTLVTVPNSEFSEIQLENFGARDQIRLYTILALRYETSPDQLRHVLAELRKLLAAHPMISPVPARVRFVAFGTCSLDLEVFAYVLTSDWNEFLSIREDIFLRMMDIVRESGTGFAFPSQTLYLGRDTGLDGEGTRKAESRVRAWRESGELPFPDFDEKTIARIDGTLDYPPHGSAVAGE